MVSLFKVVSCSSFLFVLACGDAPADSPDAGCTIQQDVCNRESDCGPSGCTDTASELIEDDAADSDIPNDMSGYLDALDGDVDAASGDEIPDNASAELPEGPVLSLSPSTTLDFGIVAVGITSERIVVVTNDGTEDLEITFEFPIEGDAANEFFCLTEFPLTIGSGESSDVHIFFINKGVQSGEITLTMKVHSNQPRHEESSLTLHADRGQTKTACIPSLTPAKIDFDNVSSGSPSTVTVGISNAGSGYCTFKFLLISDCEITGDSYDCPSPLDTDDSSTFTLATDVSTIQKLIPPDQTLNLDITFSPPVEDVQTNFAGLMLVRVADDTALGYTISYDLPVEDPVKGYEPNLIGSVADSGE